MHSHAAHSFHPFAQQFALSPHGHAVEAMLPAMPYPNTADGSWDRLTSERAQWAYDHGLDPLDGIYLRELRRRRLTLSQLGETLAIFSHGRGTVALTMRRLCALSLVESIIDDGEEAQVSCTATLELGAALEALELVLAAVDGDDPDQRRTASVAVRRAMSRVIAARRYLASGLPTDA